MWTRIALRRLASRPAFSLAVVGVVSIAVGATVLLTRIASVTLLVPSTPVEPERVVRLYTADDTRGYAPAGRYQASSWPDVREVAAAVDGKVTLSAYFTRTVAVEARGQESRHGTTFATGRYWDVVGVRPLLGTIDTADVTGAVVSHRYWRTELGGAPDAIGAVLRVSGAPVRVRAVLPPDFTGTEHPNASDLWFPLASSTLLTGEQPDPMMYHDDRRLAVIGRLAPGRTLADLAPALDAVARDLQSRHRVTNARRSFVAVPFPRVVGVAERALLGIDGALVLIAVLLGAMLLLAFANVANLFAVRSLLAQREVAIRKALGGSDRHLVADALLDVGVLVVPAMLGGWALAQGAYALWFADNAALARAAQASDGWSFVALLGTGLLATVALGAVPVLWSRAQSPDAAMRNAESDTPMRNARALWGLVALQLAVAAASGASVHSGLDRIRELESRELGFDMAPLADANIQLRVTGMGDHVHDEILAFRRRVASLPDVVGTATSETSLIGGLPLRQAIGVEGKTFAPDRVPNVRFEVVSPDYFATIGLPVLLGGFSAGVERRPAHEEIVVNRAFADAYLDRGRELSSVVLLREQFPVRVAGVVGNAVAEDLSSSTEPRFYMVHRRAGALQTFRLTVRTRGDAAAVAAALGRALSADPMVARMTTLRAVGERREAMVAPSRTVVRVMGLLAVVIAALVAIGIHGLLATSIGSVRRATAIRVALGAPPRRIAFALMRPLAYTFAAGSVLGFGLAWFVRWLSPSTALGATGVVWALVALTFPTMLAVAPLLRRALTEPPADLLRG